MLYCGNCKAQYLANDDHRFCVECGAPVRLVRSKSAPSAAFISDISSDPMAYGQPGLTPELTSLAAGLTMVDIGDRVTNVYYVNNYPGYCACGGERLGQGRCFRCPRCTRDPICVNHFDTELRLCQSCN